MGISDGNHVNSGYVEHRLIQKAKHGPCVAFGHDDRYLAITGRAGHYDIINVFQTLGNLNVFFDGFIEYMYKFGRKLSF